MKIIKAGYEILDEINEKEVMKKIEKIARVCYKSENAINDKSAEKIIKSLIKNKHDAMLEHYSFSVKFIVDRGVSHEIVRHRMASYAQESTRYCNYGGTGVTFIEPCYLSAEKSCDDNARRAAKYVDWVTSCKAAEEAYTNMLNRGATPQEARAVLPNSTKTEIVMTANLREWRHFFKLRACGVTGKPHPQMLEVAIPLLNEMKTLLPVIFGDLEAMDFTYGSKSKSKVTNIIAEFIEGLDGIKPIDTGNALKLIECLSKDKDYDQDLEKAIGYIQHLIDHLNKEDERKRVELTLEKYMHENSEAME